MYQFKIFLFLTPLLAAAVKSAENFEDANNDFTPAIYKQIAKTETGNIIVSPLSAELVLTLLELGCKGETAEELRTALYLPSNKTKIESDVKSLMTNLQSSESPVLNLANKLYLEEGFVIKESFQKIAADDFDATAENIDFSQSEEAAETINEWVEQQTNNTIKNLIGPGVLDASTVLVLVNALHFQGNWSVPFSTTTTVKSAFYKNSTDVIQVDTLTQNEKHFNYFECSSLKAQFLEMSFEGGASMIFVLPTEKQGLADVEKNIDAIFNSSIPFKSTPVQVAIPKFQFDTQIDFKKVLQALNVSKVFNQTEADLSGIAEGNLFVSAVAQKAFIDLNEGGVEAAAATYVAISRTSVVLNEKSFIADHPFIFLIQYQGVILFVGRVVDP